MGFQPPPGLARPWPLRQSFPEHWFEFSMTSGRCEGSLNPLFQKRICRYTKTGLSVNLLKIRSALLHFWNRTWRKKLRWFGNKFGESQTGRSIEVKSLDSFWGKARRPCQRLELRHPGHRSQQVTRVKICIDHLRLTSWIHEIPTWRELGMTMVESVSSHSSPPVWFEASHALLTTTPPLPGSKVSPGSQRLESL